MTAAASGEGAAAVADRAVVRLLGLVGEGAKPRALGRLRLWLAAQPPAAVVFPERIGCGLAGGRWDEYRACVEEFAAALDPALHPVVVVARKHPLP